MEVPLPLPVSDQVHVWHVNLDALNTCSDPRWELLSTEEQRRVLRFVREQDRFRAFVSRIAVRSILAAYLGCAPGSLRFTTVPKGKPCLDVGGTAAPLEFNLSHSEGRALLVVARGRAVGVDIERVRPLDDLESLSKHVLSASERAVLLRMEQQKRLQALLGSWVRKEALLKALGIGLALSPSEIELGSAATGPSLLQLPGESVPSEWKIEPVGVPEPYIAALAVRGAPPCVLQREWVP